MDIKLILCPVDFSEFSATAYRHAQSLAGHYQAKLVVQHVVELWRHPSLGYATSVELYEQYCKDLRTCAEDQLRDFVKQNGERGSQSELIVQQGVAPDLILSFAQAQKADLIVMGSHGRRGYERLMLGSVTDRVIRGASCPVLTVCQPRNAKTLVEQSGRAHHLNRILFCTDFSENSERALAYAVSVAAEYDAELTLLHVLEKVAGPTMPEAAIAAATERLDKLISATTRTILKLKTAVRIGKPYAQIIQVTIEGQFDLVIMGVQGRGNLDVAVFGSTTYRVLQLGPCPVLAVRI
jgi:nucleotide-binding universal stress UspA family protein